MIDLSLTLWPSAKRGEKRGKEARRGFRGVVIIAGTILFCPPYSVLSVSNERIDLIALALAFSETQTWGYARECVYDIYEFLQSDES